MDETRCKAVLRMMAVGKELDENWFLKKDLTNADLTALVEMGCLIKHPADPGNFMSDCRYSLTPQGQQYAWA